MGRSFVEQLRDAAQEMDADPWQMRLERLHGKIGDDGIERIPTQTIYDILEVPGRRRSSAACRRLARLMSELGWTAIRIRGMKYGAYGERVRGYARSPTRSPSVP